MIFRPFGEKEIKKNWIWKMTLADPPSPPSMEFSIMAFFLNPSLSRVFFLKVFLIVLLTDIMFQIELAEFSNNGIL